LPKETSIGSSDASDTLEGDESSSSSCYNFVSFLITSESLLEDCCPEDRFDSMKFFYEGNPLVAFFEGDESDEEDETSWIMLFANTSMLMFC